MHGLIFISVPKGIQTLFHGFNVIVMFWNNVMGKVLTALSRDHFSKYVNEFLVIRGVVEKTSGSFW